MLEIPNIEACLIGLVQQIPRRRVTTYGDLAAALGDRIAARWVGHFALNHPHYPSCRCHRVVRADGHLGLYVDGAAAKAERLQAEGVSLCNGRVDLREFGCQMELADPPLVALRQLQESVVDQVRLEPATGPWRLAAGVDVSYADPHLGVAAYALTDLAVASDRSTFHPDT